MTAFAQMLAVHRAQHRTAPRGQHPAGKQGEFMDHRFLDIPKAGFAFPLEVVTDGAAEALFDDMIRVEKRKLQPPGELPPDGGLAGAGEADEDDLQRSQLD